METIRTVSRIGLGALLLTSGALLFFRWNPAITLPRLLRGLGPLKLLAPYYLVVFKTNSALFMVSGLLTIFKLRHAVIVQFLASAIFIATYDNPLLYNGWDDVVMRVVLVLIHLVVIAAICECTCYCCRTRFVKAKPKTEETKQDGLKTE